MIDGGEVKDSNVSIRPKWSRNGYKEEADSRTLRAEAAKSNHESGPSPFLANGSLQMQVIFQHNNQQVANIREALWDKTRIRTTPLASAAFSDRGRFSSIGVKRFHRRRRLDCEYSHSRSQFTRISQCSREEEEEVKKSQGMTGTR